MRLQYYIATSFLALVLLVLGSTVTGNGEISEYEAYGNPRVKRNLICAFGLQGLIQNVFIKALKDIQKHDPMDVGDTEDGKLQDGVFYGLSSLTNVTALDISCEGDKVIFTTSLGITDAQIKYKWDRRVLFHFSGYIWTKVKKIQFAIRITWDLSEGTSFDVSDTHITKLDGFKFGFTGLGPLNPVVSGIVNVLSKIWSHKISSLMSDLIRDALKSQLNKITLPF